MSAGWSGGAVRVAWRGALAHRGALAGTALVVALGAALIAATGVLIATGAAHPFAAGTLTALGGSFGGTALLVIATVTAATVAQTLRHRRREFALLLAVGATPRQVRRLVTAEITVLGLLTAPVGAVAGLFGAPLVRPVLVRAAAMPPDVRLEQTPLAVLAGIAVMVPVVALAAWCAARGVSHTAPSQAVRAAEVEPDALGRGRRVAAAVLALSGLAVAGTPLVVSGVIGAATAATSAFLLIGAAALAAPALVARLFRVGADPHRAPGSLHLALITVRGAARRLTLVVMPLAVGLGIGAVQTGVDRAVAVGAHQQLDAGLHADLVATGGTASDVIAAARSAGADAVGTWGNVTAQVRTDTDTGGALAWEPTSIGVLAGQGRSLVDPDVSSGSLAALERPGTVAVSREAVLDVGGTGHQVAVRGADGRAHTLTVVAVFGRSLGFGDYLVGPRSAAPLGSAGAGAVLVSAPPASREAVADRLRSTGAGVTDRDAFIAHATSQSAASQHLSTVFLLALLVFLGLAAANAAVSYTAGRRREYALLRRTGATDRQLVAAAALEGLVVSAAAWLIGTLAVLPALVGVDLGLTGLPVPRLDLPTYAALSAVVLVLPQLAMVPTARRTLRATAPGADRSRGRRRGARAVTVA